jgi:hypothetical protein
VAGSLIGFIPYSLHNVYLGSLAADLSTLRARDIGRTPFEWGLYLAGFAFTVIAVLYLSRIARSALARYESREMAGTGWGIRPHEVVEMAPLAAGPASRRAASGFLDPVALLARLQSFAQPSEVGEPIELLRAGVVFHARGLINSRVMQHNLDWVWPYWIERQFDPRDPAFIPRAFSITHVNLSNRNWTAIGYPDCDALPIVDPRGLLTPHLDGWSLDAWIIGDDGRRLLPSRAKACSSAWCWIRATGS